MYIFKHEHKQNGVAGGGREGESGGQVRINQWLIF